MTPTPRLRSWYSLIAVASALLSRVLLLTAAVRTCPFALSSVVASTFTLHVQSTSTVYYRRQQQDPIFSWDNRDNSQRRIDGSDQYARFVGLTLHRRGGHIYWSDSRAIQSAPIDGSSDTRIFLGGLARVTWVGANFASPALELTVKGTRCVSVASHASDRVECLVALPERVPSPPIPSRVNEDLPTIVRAEDCVISTANGAMAGVALNFREMVAEGYPTPIVERIEIEATYVLPHALAIDADTDKDKGQQWLYWSNSADGRIYRSSLTSTAIEVVQENRWSVRGLATIPSTVPHSTTVFISQEDKGTISRFDIQTDESSSPTEPAPINGLVRGLHNPRGLAVDAVAGVLFFTEKTGRIYQVQLAGGTIVSSLPGAFPDDAAIQSATGIATRRVVTLSTRTRLDGIAVDSK